MSTPRLFYRIVAADDARPERALMILHGILGQGRNWHTLARELTTRRPDWAVVLVDLRMHGRSQGFTPPHTVAACAGDLLALRPELPLPLRAVAGHSFGGKVALAFAEEAPPDLERVFVLDATPAAGPPATGIVQVMTVLPAVPMPQPSREALVRAMVARGLPERVARWLATNAGYEGKHLVWRVDLDAVRSMLEDFLQQDFRDPLARPGKRVAIHVVKGERSPAISQEIYAWLQALPETSRVTADTLPNAGHWLHTDNPEGLLSILLRYLG